MGKKKAAVKELENHDNSPVTKVNEHLSKTPYNSRPRASCSTAVASVVLIAVLSILIGLILIELDRGNKDLNESLDKYHSSVNEKKRADDLKAPIPKERDINDIPRKPPAPPPPSPSGSKKEKVEKKEVKSPHQEKPEDPDMEPVPVPEPKIDETRDPESPTEEKVPLKRQKDIEKQIVSDKPLKPNVSKPDDAAVKPGTTKEKIDEQPKPEPEISDGKKQNEGPDLSKTPKSEISEEKVDLPKPKEDKMAEANLEDLYMEVESIAEEILLEDPENSMVKQLAPHLEGVLRDLEGGKLSGLRDSLLHIKLILTDLKERLNESRREKTSEDSEAKKRKPEEELKKPESSKKQKDDRVPVDEVIPDPIYIAPLGDKDKDKDQDASQPLKKEDPSTSTPKQKVPVDEVISEPVYIDPLGETEDITEAVRQREQDKPSQLKSQTKSDLKQKVDVEDKQKVTGDDVEDKEKVTGDSKQKIVTEDKQNIEPERVQEVGSESKQKVEAESVQKVAEESKKEVASESKQKDSKRKKESIPIEKEADQLKEKDKPKENPEKIVHLVEKNAPEDDDSQVTDSQKLEIGKTLVETKPDEKIESAKPVVRPEGNINEPDLKIETKKENREKRSAEDKVPDIQQTVRDKVSDVQQGTAGSKAPDVRQEKNKADLRKDQKESTESRQQKEIKKSQPPSSQEKIPPTTSPTTPPQEKIPADPSSMPAPQIKISQSDLKDKKREENIPVVSSSSSTTPSKAEKAEREVELEDKINIASALEDEVTILKTHSS